MGYIDIPSPLGGCLFKYDPERQLIALRTKNAGVVYVDLTRYQPHPRSPPMHRRPLLNHTTPIIIMLDYRCAALS